MPWKFAKEIRSPVLTEIHIDISYGPYETVNHTQNLTETIHDFSFLLFTCHVWEWIRLEQIYRVRKIQGQSTHQVSLTSESNLRLKTAICASYTSTCSVVRVSTKNKTHGPSKLPKNVLFLRNIRTKTLITL